MCSLRPQGLLTRGERPQGPRQGLPRTAKMQASSGPGVRWAGESCFLEEGWAVSRRPLPGARREPRGMDARSRPRGQPGSRAPSRICKHHLSCSLQLSLQYLCLPSVWPQLAEGGSEDGNQYSKADTSQSFSSNELLLISRLTTIITTRPTSKMG